MFENSRHSFAFYSEWMEEKPRASNETTTNKKIMEERARKRGKNPKRNYLIIINSGIITLASAVESDFEKNEEEKARRSSRLCFAAERRTNESEPTIDNAMVIYAYKRTVTTRLNGTRPM